MIQRLLTAVVVLFMLTATVSPVAAGTSSNDEVVGVGETPQSDNPSPPTGNTSSSGHPKISSQLLSELPNPDSGAIRTASADYVKVVIEASPGQSKSAIRLVQKNGGKVEVQEQGLIQAKVPKDAVRSIADSNAINYVRKPIKPKHALDQGNIVSEGLDNIGASTVHDAGYTGKNVTIAVIDLGFDLNNPEIKGHVTDFHKPVGNFTNQSRSHGTAVTEVIVDTAPQASIVAIEIETVVEFLAAVDYVEQNTSADIVSMSLGVVGFRLDGESIMDQKIDQSVANGTTWFVSAGNSGYKHHWNGTWKDGDNDQWHNFTTSDETINLGSPSYVAIYMTWDDWENKNEDYDLYIYNASGGVVASSTNVQDGSSADPKETITQGFSGSTQLYLAIRNVSANGTSDFNIFFWGGSSPEYWTASQSITVPATGPNATAVGAVHENDNSLERFSSRGPTVDGRLKPDVVAPDAVSTSVYPSFYGTSAAAPHSAGVAALLLDANESLGPSQIEQTLKSNGNSVLGNEPNNKTGHGLVDATESTKSVADITIQEFRITDGYKSINNSKSYQTIEVSGSSDEVVSNFNIFYNDTGPLNFSNGGIVQAKYANGTTQKSGTAKLNQTIGGGKVKFLLNRSKAPFTKKPTRINVTVYSSTDVSATDDENKSLLTINYLAFNVTNTSGSSIQTLFHVFNQSTNEVTALGITDPNGYFAQHCRGIIRNGECIDPSTGNASSLVIHAGTAKIGNRKVDLYNGADITESVNVTAINLATSNTSGRIGISPNSSTQLKTEHPRAGMGYHVRSLGLKSTRITKIQFIDPKTENTVYQWNSDSGVFRNAFHAKTNKRYRVQATLAYNGSSITINRSHIASTKGSNDLSIQFAPNSLKKSTVVGQIVNDSGSPVPGAVVYAQWSGSSSPFATNVINSTTTGPNGKFSMSLPTSEHSHIWYQFRIVSNQTNSSTPVYYPTVENNDGSAYKVSDSKTVLPQFVLKPGGRVDVSVTANGSNVTSLAIAELSRTTTRTGERTRSAVSSDFGEFAVPGITPEPKRAEIDLVSPTTGSNSNSSYNVWGVNFSTFNVEMGCVNQVNVNQGTSTDSDCEFSQTGRLNLSVINHQSLFQRTNSKLEPVAGGFYWHNNLLIIRNATDGDVVTFLGPRGTQANFLSFAENQRSSRGNLSIPLPPGNYTVELRSSRDYIRKTDTRDHRTVKITAGNTTDFRLNRSNGFDIQRVPGRSSPTFERSANSTVAVRIIDRKTGKTLTDSYLNVSGRLHYPNGTTATEPFSLSYNSSDKTFDSEINPKDLGLKAGKYNIRITAGNKTDIATYNSTRSRPVTITGFQLSLDPGGFTFGLGDTVTANIFAYNTTADPPVGINASASNITVEIYDTNGKLVNSTSPSSGISEGRGTIDITMPTDRGIYRIVTFAEADDGKQGIGENWVRVSDIDVDTTTDKDVYTATDTVQLTVSVSNATSDAALSGSSVEATIDGNASVSGATGADGQVTFQLDPSNLASGGKWEGGFHFVSLTVTNETDTGIRRVRTGVHFRVQTIDAFVRPTRQAFRPEDNATIDVYIPPNLNVSSVDATSLDGKSVNVTGSKIENGYWRIDLGQRSVGEHQFTVTVATPSDSQEFKSSFKVSSFNIQADTDTYRYATGEQINVSVTVTHANNGTAVANKQVNATLYRVSSPNDIIQASASATTDNTGTASIESSSFNSTAGGSHYIVIEVGQQRRFLGVQINSVNVTMLDSLGGNQVYEYTVAPGETGKLYINATNTTTGAALPDGSRATAFLSAFGDTFQLNTNTTTNGKTVLKFRVPESAPERRYGLKVRVTSPNGDEGATYGTLHVSGGSALTISGQPDKRFYSPQENATFTATVRYGNGTAVSGQNVTFIIGSNGGGEITVGSAKTDTAGTASITHQISRNRSDGEYYLKVSLENRSNVKDYTGFRLSRLQVSLTANQSTFAPGDTIGLTVNATNESTGQLIDATSGGVRILSPQGERFAIVNTTGKAPYKVNISVPNSTAAIGSYTLQAGISKNGSVDVETTFVEVVNDSATLNISAPANITAGDTINITLNASVDTTASLTVFSPGTGTSVYENSSISLSANTPKNETVTLSSGGVYIIRAQANGIGTSSIVRKVESPDVSVWTGPTLSTNGTSFNTTESIYIKSNVDNATATVIGNDSTYSVALNQQSGDVHYGVLNTKRAASIYLVRLDLANATATDSTVIRVSN